MNREHVADPAAFQRDLHVPTGSGPRRFGEYMADFQRERFEAINPSLIAVAQGAEPPRRRFWIEATKGASKDSDLAICLLWLVAFAPRTVRVQIGAYDADQADEIRLIVKQILRIDAPLNRSLAAIVEVRADQIVNTRTGSAAEILTTDSRGSHGSRPDVVLVNELSHVQDEEFAQTLLDNADKVPRGLVIVATNAGFENTWQHVWQQAALSSARWTCHLYQRPAPWIDAADIEESRRRNPPTRFNRLWRGIWAPEGSGDAIDGRLIDAAFTLPGPHSRPREGYSYVIGCDLGLKRDSSAAALLGIDLGHWRDAPGAQPARPTNRIREVLADMFADDEPADTFNPSDAEPDAEFVSGSRRIELARLHLWSPAGGRVSLTEVENTVADLAREFNVARILCDQWQAALLVERLQARGLPAIGVDFTGSLLKSLASAVMSAFQERRLALFEHEQLGRDLRALRLVEKSYGVRLESPRGPDGHGDAATALALGLHGVRTIEHCPPTAVQGELICYP